MSLNPAMGVRQDPSNASQALSDFLFGGVETARKSRSVFSSRVPLWESYALLSREIKARSRRPYSPDGGGFLAFSAARDVVLRGAITKE